MKSSAEVTFGLWTNVPGGGFAGKYSVIRTIDPSEPDGNFDVEFPISEFRPVTADDKFSMSPIGEELAEWYCVIKGKNIGLAIKHVELLPPADVVEGSGPKEQPGE